MGLRDIKEGERHSGKGNHPVAVINIANIDCEMQKDPFAEKDCDIIKDVRIAILFSLHICMS